MTDQPGPSRHLYEEQQRRRWREQHRLTGHPRPAEEERYPSLPGEERYPSLPEEERYPSLPEEEHDPTEEPGGQVRAPARFRLVALSGDEAGEQVELQPGRWRIGRDPSCEISVSDMSVSQFHAIVTVTEHGVRIEDLGSTNHTYVNDELAEYPRELVPGDRIRLGLVTLTLEEGSAGAAGPGDRAVGPEAPTCC